MLASCSNKKRDCVVSGSFACCNIGRMLKRFECKISSYYYAIASKLGLLYDGNVAGKLKQTFIDKKSQFSIFGLNRLF